MCIGSYHMLRIILSCSSLLGWRGSIWRTLTHCCRRVQTNRAVTLPRFPTYRSDTPGAPSLTVLGEVVDSKESDDDAATYTRGSGSVVFGVAARKSRSWRAGTTIRIVA